MSFHSRRRVATIGVLLAFSTACATASGSGVPHLRPERLAHITMDSVQPRQVQLSISDERDPRPASSATMLAEVDQAARTMLEQANITVRPDAPNVLTIKVAYPDSASKHVKREDCVVMRAVILLMNGSRATAGGALACYSYKNAYGMRLDSDATGVYEDVLNSTFRGLDQVLGGRASH
jgi:hypothetical protein